MKSSALLLLFCFFIVLQLSAQITLDEKNAINALPLNESLAALRPHMYLITGNESIYQQNESLRKIILNNIQNGIREGIHEGSEYNRVLGEKATKTTFHFYQDELYKIRWSFSAKQYPNLPELASRLDQQLTAQFGEPEEAIPATMYVWQGRKNYLQTFFDEDEFQIELRDEKINTAVENL